MIFKKRIENEIFNNYDNMEMLSLAKYLIQVVIEDIEDLDLGNNKTIKVEDLESLSSIVDTINDIENYNI